MKALVYTGPETLDYREVADPEPGDGEALIRVESVGICGSDMHAYLGHDERRPAPLVLGHEAAGVVLSGALEGQRVTVNPLVTCGACPACISDRDNLCATRQIISMAPREGAFAGLLSMPERNLVHIPDHISTHQAALAEPIACGWHAVRLGRAVLGTGPNQALVLGGGAIGLGAALSLTAQGIDDITIIEPHAARRAYLGLHCDQTVLPPEALDASEQFDIVVDGVGFEATRAQASAHARPGGVIVHIGLGQASGGLDIRRMTLQEITFIGTYTYTAKDFRACAQAMFDGRMGTLDWVEDRPLDQGARAFEDIRAGRVSSPKIILSP
ncbi:alcohol dehydrogenase catalytic domain-containing protein [uncultured Roseovarius sp.]|uniref:zinc-dependent alcohol dehydrogenase n=1 Tax=uncultured Roseovarius sp. TaxID=293344 RepID=UPI002621EC46|nr:alcohol dehydrogenase catalytic domain-containing protein [uncultured Roseovarius sp.]